jgi:hypothetical protein
VRGGYESVCATHRWGEVTRSLGLDASQPSMDAMRVAYEGSLLDFEQYVRCGRYSQDAAAGRQPQFQKSDRDATLQQVARAGAAAARGPPPPPRPQPQPQRQPRKAPAAAGLVGLMQPGQAQTLALAQLQMRTIQQLAAQQGANSAQQAMAAQLRMLQQHAQLTANPQLALLLQQQQAAAAAAAAATAAAAARGGQPPAAAATAAAGSTPATAVGAPPMPAAGAGRSFSAMLDDS